MRPFCFTLLFSLTLLSVMFAQVQQMFQRLPATVYKNGVALSTPFAGGFNAPQFSAADLNHDGISDLVAFDRAGDILVTYLNAGTPNEIDYTFAPEYACNFPLLVDYVVLRDFNQDGAADIFTASIEPGTQEIQVYQGYFDNNVLKFKPYVFGYPANCENCDPLLIYYPSSVPGFWNNFSVSRTDYPAIDDIDGDGDLDIVAFPSGNSTHLTYLKNQSVEMGYGLDSLKFELADNCWGRFYENGMTRCRTDLASSPDCCAPCFGPAVVEDRDSDRHPGATITTYDQDGDGDKEVILGNLNSECLSMMTNGGSAAQAWMTEQDSMFPQYDVPVNLARFPASFYLDADNDGHRDLIVSVNNKNGGEDQRDVWFYKNTSAGNPHFELQTKTLFVEDMVDLGTATHPVFADVNADGLQDLVVGNYGYFTSAFGTNASLYLFLNIGTPTQPQFSLTNSDWLGMSQFAPINDYDFSPAFGDLDGDGDQDLVVGSNLGSFYYYRNIAGAGNPMNFVLDQDPMWVLLDVGQISAPALFDLDNDGLKDLIAGERLGNINFFKNIGSPTQPMFSPTITVQRLGDITTAPYSGGVGFSAPTILNTNDGPMLIVGGADGSLRAYQNLSPTNVPYSLVNLTWGNIDEGNRSSPAFADLDDDGYVDMVVGNYRGGLGLYTTLLADCVPASSVHSPAEQPVKISPNPASNWIQVSLPTAGRVTWRAFNALGQTTATGQGDSNQFNILVNNWLPGVYFLDIESNGHRSVAKVVVRH